MHAPIWKVKSALSNYTASGTDSKQELTSAKSLQTKLYEATVLNEAPDNSTVSIGEAEMAFLVAFADQRLNG